MQGYTRIYKDRRGYAGIYRTYQDVQGYTRIYRDIQGCTMKKKDIKDIQGYARIHEDMQRYTRILRVSSNLQLLPNPQI